MTFIPRTATIAPPDEPAPAPAASDATRPDVGSGGHGPSKAGPSPNGHPRAVAHGEGASDRVVFPLLIVGLLALFLPLQNPYWVPAGDGEFYTAIARNIARGDGYVFNGQPVAAVPPGWPALMAAIMTVAPYFVALKLTVLALMSGALAVTYWIARRYTTPVKAALVILMTALVSHVYQGTYWLISESPFCLVSAGALLVAMQVREGRGGWGRIVVLAGLCAAAVLVRWAGVLGCMLVVATLLDGELLPRRDRRWVAVALCILATAVTFMVLRKVLEVTPEQAAAAQAFGAASEESASASEPSGDDTPPAETPAPKAAAPPKRDAPAAAPAGSSAAAPAGSSALAAAPAVSSAAAPAGSSATAPAPMAASAPAALAPEPASSPAAEVATTTAPMLVPPLPGNENREVKLPSLITGTERSTGGYLFRLSEWGRWLSFLYWQPFRAAAGSVWVDRTALAVGWVLLALLAFAAARDALAWRWFFPAVLLYCLALALNWPMANARYYVPVAGLLTLSILRAAAMLRDIRPTRAWRRGVGIATVAFVASVVTCNAALWAVEVAVAHSDDFYGTYEGGLNQQLVAAARYLNEQDVDDGQVAINPRYVNLNKVKLSPFGLRAMTLLTGRPVSPMPRRWHRTPPGPRLSRVLARNGIRYYVTQTPVSPWRVWHFRVPWWQEMQTNAPAEDLDSGWQLYRVDELTVMTRIDLPPSRDWPTRVPGLESGARYASTPPAVMSDDDDGGDDSGDADSDSDEPLRQ